MDNRYHAAAKESIKDASPSTSHLLGKHAVTRAMQKLLEANATSPSIYRVEAPGRRCRVVKTTSSPQGEKQHSSKIFIDERPSMMMEIQEGASPSPLNLPGDQQFYKEFVIDKSARRGTMKSTKGPSSNSDETNKAAINT